MPEKKAKKAAKKPTTKELEAEIKRLQGKLDWYKKKYAPTGHTHI
jgi:hypothetical protein